MTLLGIQTNAPQLTHKTVTLSGAAGIVLHPNAIPNIFQTFIGAITGDSTIAFPTGSPSYAGLWVVTNSTTGGHNLLLQVSGQASPIVLEPGGKVLVFSDGTTLSQLVPRTYASVSVWSEAAPTNGQVIARFVCAQACTIPKGGGLSQLSAAVAATASSVCTIQKVSGGVTTTVGTATFAIAGTVATFSVAAAVNFAVGDMIVVVAPATADGTLAGIVGSIVLTV